MLLHLPSNIEIQESPKPSFVSTKQIIPWERPKHISFKESFSWLSLGDPQVGRPVCKDAKLVWDLRVQYKSCAHLL